MPILASVETAPPVPPDEQPWPGLGVTWTDYRGTVWDLLTGESGVVLDQGGVRGLGMPPVNRFTSAPAALPGTRWRGFRTDERECFWPIYLWADAASQAWLDLDREWWAGLVPDQTGVWTITTPTGGARTLRLRYSDDGDPAFGTDPTVLGWYVYGITLVAEQPYWAGQLVHRDWTVAGAGNWLSPTSGVLQITPGATVDTATIPNPGDVDAWPIWTVTGPVTSAHLGIGGGAVDYNASIAAGATVTIDTRPDRMTATTDTGADVTSSCTWNPLPVPPGASVTADIALTAPGAGARASCDLEPLYWRAW